MTKAKLTELQKGVLYAAAVVIEGRERMKLYFHQDLARDPITPTQG